MEDIVAEKLRAILQLTHRNRMRSQDVLDIAHLVRERAPDIDVAQVSMYLPLKCQNREITPTRLAFRDPETRMRAHANYEALRDTVRYIYIPFDEAWAEVLALVDRLEIPDA